MTTDTTIRARIQARKLISIVEDDAAKFPETERAKFVRAYCETLVEECRKRLPPDPATQPRPGHPGPMSDASATVWAQQTTMTFGKFKGSRVIDVPLSYLVWYSEQKDEFKELVNRYLLSPAVQRELERVEEEREERERDR